MVVVKVGGSLYDLPELASRLRSFVATLGGAPCLLVPGGGATAEAVRVLDHTHGLGARASHWLALRACSLNACFLHELLPLAAVVAHPCPCPSLGILDPHAFLLADEGQPRGLPHTWEATSDSVAARAAEVAGAELVLLKSVSIDPEGAGGWVAAAAAGHVDPVFPSIVVRAGLRVRTINLRAWAGAADR